VKARRGAIAVLLEVIVDGRSLSATLAAHKTGITAGERPLLQELCYGVVRYYWQLSAILELLLEKPLARKHADVRIVLLLGLYQMIHTRIPDHAVVMESVSLAEDLGKGWSKGLVNAVLRAYQRKRASIDGAASEFEEARFCHPAWLISRLRSAWPARADDLLRTNNVAPPMALRVNGRRIARDAYLRSLTNEGIDARAAKLADSGIYLELPREVEAIPGFSRGLVSVQDEAAQLAAPLLCLAPGLRVLDACAAPGGKSAHVLELEPKLAEMTALDIDRDRLAMAVQNFTRLGLSGSPLEGDATQPARWWRGEPYDRILLDAPCSGTGVIRRNPDIKLLRKEEDIAKLAGQQGVLLDALWPLLKSGGIMVYATCSVLPEENWLVVSEFLQRTPDAVEKPITERWGEAVQVGRQLLTCSRANDGFYYARLEKV
jgi:16S rRNA (cytosine967-C5)-methyltransferase